MRFRFVKAIAHVVTAHDRGEGVEELVSRLLAGEFEDPLPSLASV
jgi:hypothetical protein